MTPFSTSLTNSTATAATPPTPAPDEPPLHAAHRHHDSAGAHDEDRTGQVGLQHHQDGKNAKNHGIGHNALPPLQHFLPLFGDAVGEVDDDRQLGDLRGLEGKDTVDAQPAAGVVVFDADTGNDDQHQQKEREDQQESGRAAPALIVEPGGASARPARPTAA